MGAVRRAKLDVRGVSLDLYNERTGKSLPVLRDIDLAVFDGELVSIVGPSGCGKSTFLNAVDGLIRVTSGEILVDGRAVNGPGPDRAMVFQHDSLFPWRTVRENVMYGLDLQGRLAKAERRERALALVELVGLTGFADHYPHELSGGMRQRVNIARALGDGAAAPPARRAVRGARRPDPRIHAGRAAEDSRAREDDRAVRHPSDQRSGVSLRSRGGVLGAARRHQGRHRRRPADGTLAGGQASAARSSSSSSASGG